MDNVEIYPSIETAIEFIDKKNSAILSRVNIEEYFDNLITNGLEKRKRERDEFIKDYFSNPNNKWRSAFEASAGRGFGGMVVDHKSFTTAERSGLEKIGFSFTKTNDIEEVWFPSLKYKR